MSSIDWSCCSFINLNLLKYVPVAKRQFNNKRPVILINIVLSGLNIFIYVSTELEALLKRVNNFGHVDFIKPRAIVHSKEY